MLSFALGIYLQQVRERGYRDSPEPGRSVRGSNRRLSTLLTQQLGQRVSQLGHKRAITIMPGKVVQTTADMPKVDVRNFRNFGGLIGRFPGRFSSADRNAVLYRQLSNDGRRTEQRPLKQAYRSSRDPATVPSSRWPRPFHQFTVKLES